MNGLSLWLISPELFLCMGILIHLILEMSLEKGIHRWIANSAVFTATCALAIGASCVVWSFGSRWTLFDGLLIVDRYSALAKIILSACTLLTYFLTPKTLCKYGSSDGEYFSLLLLATLGMFVLASAANFLILFLGIELLSIPLYVLVALKKNMAAVEAAIKYLVPGGFAAGVLTLGISFVYGATGTLAFSGVAMLGPTLTGLPLYALGIFLILAAVGFKVSLVPFHAWTPDVYKGSGTTVTAFMSVAVKSAVFFVFIRLMAQLKTFQMIHLDQVIAFLAVVSIVFGNLVALRQTSFKGLMAYSSISHAGYMALGLVTNTAASRSALTFYVAIYAIMNLLAFAAFLFLKDRKEGASTLSDLTGLGRQFPFWGLVFSLSLFSLAAIPPFPGFLAKYLVFSEAIKAGYYVTTVVALLGSAVSVYYYLRVVYIIYVEPVADKNKVSAFFPIGEKSLLVGSILLTVLFFVLTLAPNFLLEIVSQASAGL